jgi:galactose oxidase-like protein
LITGGSVANVGIQPDSEIYDPATGVFSRISLDSGYSKATPLFDGRILIADGTSTPHLYDPTTDAVEPLGFLTRAVGSHTMSLLPTGKVLIAGGYAADNYLEIALDHAELFDPASGAFQKTASLSYARYGHTATLLSNGLLLIAGGIDYSVVTTAELFDPYTETFQTTGRMNSVHGYHSATLLRNGTVLFSGGIDASAELYIPPERPSISFDRVLVRSGESFNTTPSGLSPSDNSFYDLRFHAPGDSTEYVALNWQLGRSAAHNVATGMATGTWTVTGVRPHQDIDDHTGDFASVSVELLVTK